MHIKKVNKSFEIKQRKKIMIRQIKKQKSSRRFFLADKERIPKIKQVKSVKKAQKNLDTKSENDRNCQLETFYQTAPIGKPKKNLPTKVIQKKTDKPPTRLQKEEKKEAYQKPQKEKKNNYKKSPKNRTIKKADYVPKHPKRMAKKKYIKDTNPIYQKKSNPIKEKKESYFYTNKKTQKSSQIQRNRILTYIGNQIQTDESKDSIGAVAKDILKMKLMSGVMAMMKYIASGFFALLTQVMVVTLPVILIIAILYHSPLAIFLPPFTEDETISSVLHFYETEFYQKIEEEKNNQSNCDYVQVSFTNLDSSGIPARNFNDVLCVYMIKYGFGNMATVMNDQTKRNLFDTFHHMCNYTVFFETEIIETTRIEIQEDGNEIEVMIEEMITTKIMIVTLLNYEDIIAEGGLAQEDIELLKEMMNSEYVSQIYVSTHLLPFRNESA